MLARTIELLKAAMGSRDRRRAALGRARPWRAGLAGFAATLAVLIVAAVGFEVYERAIDARADAAREAGNLARTLEVEARHLRGTARFVQGEVADVLGPQVDWDALDHARLRRLSAGLPPVFETASLVLADATGRIRFGSSGDARGADAYVDDTSVRRHRDDPRADPVIGPASARPGAEPAVPMSWRLSRSDGSFAGLAVLGLDTRSLGAVSRGLDLGPGGAVVLYGPEGRRLLRVPGEDAAAGPDSAPPDDFAAAAGSTALLWSPDGRRVTVFRRAADGGAIVAVQRAWSFDAWQTSIYVHLGEIAVLLAVLLVGVGLLERSRLAQHRLDRRLKSTFDAVANGIVVRDRAGRVVDANPSAAMLLGVPREQMLGRTLEASVPDALDPAGAVLPLAQRPFYRALRDGAVVRDEIVGARTPAGAVRWMSTNTSVVRDEMGAPSLVVTSYMDITDRRRLERERDDERAILGQVARGEPLDRVLTAICVAFERDHPGMLCAVMLATSDGRHLRSGAAPSLPPAYCRAVDGIAVGPASGCCGTAAFIRARVVVTDTLSDPLWEGLHDIAREAGLLSCWSTPILAAAGTVLGTFAVYGQRPASPDDAALRAIDRLTGVAAVAIERSLSLNALRESELRLRAVMDHIVDGLLTVDGTGRIVSANAAASRIFGYADGELVGRDLGTLVPEAARAAHHRLLTEFGPGEAEEVLGVARTIEGRHRDGSTFPLEIALGEVPLADGGRQFVASLRDVAERHAAETALRRSEAQFRGLFELMPIPLIAENTDYRITAANAAACRFFDAGGPQDLVGRNYIDLVDPREAELVIAARKVDRPGLPRPRIERRFVTLSGRPVIGEITGGWIETGDGSAILAAIRDITLQYAADAALRRSEARFRTLFELMPVPLIAQNPDHRIVSANAAACRFFDAADPHDLAGRYYLDLVDPSETEAVVAAQAADRPETLRPPTERRFVTLTGREVIGEISGRWIETGGGYEIIAVIRDITLQHAADEALRRSEARNRTVVDFLPIALLTLRGGRIAALNPAARLLFELGDDAAVIDSEFLDLVHPADRPATLDQRVRRATGAAWLRRVERRYVTRAGRAFTGEATVTMLGEGPDSDVLLAIVDVSERQAAERALRETALQLRTVIDNLPLSVGYADSGERIGLVNVVCARWHASSGAALVGRTLAEVLPPDWYQANHDRLRRALTGETVRIEGTRDYPDGKTRIIDALLVPDRHGDETRGAFFFVSDVTERVRTEEQLRHAQKMEAVGQLTGGVAHDFNNILAVVMGNLDLLALEVAEQPRLHGFVEKALRGTERGAELTRRLLAFSRRQDLHPRRMDVNAVVSGIVELFARTLGRNITIETRLAPDVDGVVIDPGQLDNALLNLAVNARDAMPEGGRLTVETAIVRFDQAYAVGHPDVAPGIYEMIAVSDTGQGMTPEVAARAFEPFFTTKDIGKGSGLGLSMVYGFVKQSGGHIEIHSAPGRGTTVRLYLPQAPAMAVDTVPPAAPAARCGAAQHILVVEDDEGVRDIVVGQLAGLGYRVAAAATGPAALAHLATGAPVDLLLTDIVMPGGMSGIDAAAAALSERPGLRVLFISGYAEGGGNRERILAQGGQVLAKPFTRAQLADAVARALDGVPSMKPA